MLPSQSENTRGALQHLPALEVTGKVPRLSVTRVESSPYSKLGRVAPSRMEYTIFHKGKGISPPAVPAQEGFFLARATTGPGRRGAAF